MPWMPSVGGSGEGTNAADVHIVGFGTTVDVFQSKQLPKKLTIFGDDFRSRDFVAKVLESPVGVSVLASL